MLILVGAGTAYFAHVNCSMRQHKRDRFLNTSSTIGFVHGIPTADKVATSLWSRIQKATT
jgi:hypothetical protein